MVVFFQEQEKEQNWNSIKTSYTMTLINEEWKRSFYSNHFAWDLCNQEFGRHLLKHGYSCNANKNSTVKGNTMSNDYTQ